MTPPLEAPAFHPTLRGRLALMEQIQRGPGSEPFELRRALTARALRRSLMTSRLLWSAKVGIVLLANLAQAGEAYEQEYKEMSLGHRIRALPQILVDGLVVNHDKPTETQVRALRILSGVLKEFFNITRLGGHREYQMLTNGKGRACPGNLGMTIVKSLRSELGLSAPGK